jgi:iron complex outermembrane receptor protein
MPYVEVWGKCAGSAAAGTKGDVPIFGQVVPFDSYPDTPRISGSFDVDLILPTPDKWGEMSVRVGGFSQSSTYFSSNSGSIDPRVQLPG